jgi:hypothetical protein
MKWTLVVIASACTSTLTGSKGALGTGTALALAAGAAAAAAGGALGADALAGDALSAELLFACAPSQLTSVRTQLTIAALRRKLTSFRRFRAPGIGPGYAYHPCVREGSSRHD